MIILPKLFAYNNKHLIAMFPSDWQSEGKMRSGLRYLYYAFFSMCKSHSNWSVRNRWDPPMSDFKVLSNIQILHTCMRWNGRFCNFIFFKRIVYNVGWGLLGAFYQAGCFLSLSAVCYQNSPWAWKRCIYAPFADNMPMICPHSHPSFRNYWYSWNCAQASLLKPMNEIIHRFKLLDSFLCSFGKGKCISIEFFWNMT